MRLHRLFGTLTFFACALLPLACGKPTAPPIGHPSDTAQAAEVADASAADADIADTTSQDVTDAAAVKDTVGDEGSAPDQVDVDDGDTPMGETVLPDMDVDVDTQEIAEVEDSADTDGDADSSDSAGSMIAACDVGVPDAATIVEGSACIDVGSSVCAPSPNSVQAQRPIGIAVPAQACLPTDTFTCATSGNGPIWKRTNCNDLAKADSCFDLPEAAPKQGPWSLLHSGSGCRQGSTNAFCCPARLHAGAGVTGKNTLWGCPPEQAGMRICMKDNTRIYECRVMPSLSPPEPYSLTGIDLAAFQQCANSAAGCMYEISWYRDHLQGKLYCDLPNTIPPKKVDVVPRCIMDNGQARWAKTCDEHFNGVPDP
jgi:hypothetical protein